MLFVYHKKSLLWEGLLDLSTVHLFKWTPTFGHMWKFLKLSLKLAKYFNCSKSAVSKIIKKNTVINVFLKIYLGNFYKWSSELAKRAKDTRPPEWMKEALFSNLRVNLVFLSNCPEWQAQDNIKQSFCRIYCVMFF